MEAVLVDVANAVKDALHLHDFGVDFESAMSYADATKQLNDINGKLAIDVVPWRSIPKFGARGVLQYQCSVDVIARRKFALSDQDGTGLVAKAEVNRLVKLIEDIDEFFLLNANAKALTLARGGWKAQIKSSDKKQDYSRLHLYGNQQFTGWIRVTYDAAKEV